MKLPPPDLVFNEPVATGWASIQYYGDQTRAGQLLMEGRAQLGWMRTIYGINQRLADGDPGGYYQQTSTLADGSEILTVSNNGYDLIRIIAAGSRPAPKRRRPVDLHVDDMMICGTCTDADGNNHAVLWQGLNDVIDLGFLQDGSSAEAYDISNDGSTVVGMARDATSTRCAFRWTQAEGMQSLGFLPGAAIAEAYATGVSANGNMVAGRSYDANGLQAWIWVKDVGFTILPPVLDYGVPVTARFVISPSGEYVAGVVSVPVENNRNVMGAVWHIDHSGTVPTVTGPQLLEPGTVSQRADLIAPSQPALASYADFCIPSAVTDDGVVYGNTSHTNYVVTTEHVHAVYDSGLVDDQVQTHYTDNPNLQATAFKSDPAIGAVLIIGDGTGGGTANDTGALCGWSQVSDLVVHTTTTRLYTEETGGWTETFTADVFDPRYQEGWVLVPDPDHPDDYRRLTLGAFTHACDITPDGDTVVGYSLSDALGTTGDPMAWTAGGDEYVLPMPGGMEYGKATAIATFVVVDVSGTEDTD